MGAGSISRTGTSGAVGVETGFVFRVLFNKLSMRLALGVLALTFVLPPDGAGVPLCWFHSLYGLPCPGCGMTRSLTSITHLHLAEAFGYHPFGFVVWVLMVVLAVANFAGARRLARVETWLGERQRWARPIYLGLVIGFVAFGMARLVVVAATSGVVTG